MFQPTDLARFALSEFERGLDGLTEEETRTRVAKADGTQMNAISWTVGHRLALAERRSLRRAEAAA